MNGHWTKRQKMIFFTKQLKLQILTNKTAEVEIVYILVTLDGPSTLHCEIVV